MSERNSSYRLVERKKRKYGSGVWQVSRVEKGKRLKQGKQRMGKKCVLQGEKIRKHVGWKRERKNVDHSRTCISVCHLFILCCSEE